MNLREVAREVGEKEPGTYTFLVTADDPPLTAQNLRGLEADIMERHYDRFSKVSATMKGRLVTVITEPA